MHDGMLCSMRAYCACYCMWQVMHDGTLCMHGGVLCMHNGILCMYDGILCMHDGKNQLVVFSTEGQFVTSYGAFGTQEGQFWHIVHA